MQIVDTHQHLWDLDLFRYSWLGSLPALNHSFRMSDYLAAAKGLDVVKSVQSTRRHCGLRAARERRFQILS